MKVYHIQINREQPYEFNHNTHNNTTYTSKLISSLFLILFKQLEHHNYISDYATSNCMSYVSVHL